MRVEGVDFQGKIQHPLIIINRESGNVPPDPYDISIKPLI